MYHLITFCLPLLLEFTPLEFETGCACGFVGVCFRLEFTPLEFETGRL